ncbi:hypothetical protein [Robbsia sp. KACC 23696]|uniref:hypothetical protein n=1 Tax=Robbsia sp. KACC 23696 TaxID=3149231 RepID=UPI00325B36CB
MEANNRMTFSQFVELLPMAFGEETGVPIERETLTAIDQLGRASYTTRSGFAMTVEKGFPEERCTVRLRTNIAFVYPVTMDGIRLTSMLTYLQYAISTSKISITNNAEILERQVSLFDLTPERVESEIAKFCKNCFCALTMLEHSVCPIGHQEKIRRMVMPAKGVPNPSPEWAQLPASESSLWKKSDIELGQIRIIKGKDLDLIGSEKTSESQLFPPSAKSNQLSHLRRCNDDTGPHDHVRHWRAFLQGKPVDLVKGLWGRREIRRTRPRRDTVHRYQVIGRPYITRHLPGPFDTVQLSPGLQARGRRLSGLYVMENDADYECDVRPRYAIGKAVINRKGDITPSMQTT